MRQLQKRRGQLVCTDHSGGRSVAEHWYYLFENNELLFSQGSTPLTDEELTAAMQLAFPGRPSKVFYKVQWVRARCRSGRQIKGRRICSYRYLKDERGRVYRDPGRANLDPGENDA